MNGISNLRSTLALGVMLIAMGGLYAQKVTADLSQEVTAVGQPVQLNISVIGGQGAKMPGRIDVEGLDVRLAGRSEQVNVVNFQMTVSSIYSYLVVPEREGDFVIPSITVTIGGRQFDTPPLALRVGSNSGGVPVLPALPARPQQQGYPPQQQVPQVQQPSQAPVPQPPPSGNKLAFGDLIIPKKSAYVGEVIPVEIRFYFNANCPVRVADKPNFSGDGFTVMNFGKPAERQQNIGGQIYNVIIFQTAITAVKSGPLEVAAAKIDTQIQVPSRQSIAPSDDFFGGLFGNSGFGMDTRELTVETKPMTLDVKALPVAGRPEDFSGAIGQFSLSSTASPKKADAGDPISLAVTVAGRGNFDGMNAPVLQDAESWKSYTPNEKFTASPSDPIGFNGKKTFEYMIVARTDANSTPVPEFSYFDPELAKYVTLKGAPIPVIAKGGGPSAPGAQTAVASHSPTPTPAPSLAPTATPTPSTDDALVHRFEKGDFEPLLRSKTLIVANTLAALVLLALVGFGIGRMAFQSSFAKDAARRRETRRLLGTLEDSSLEPAAFFQTAEDYIRARLAPDDHVTDTRDLIRRARLDPQVEEETLRVLDQADERRYAAGGFAGSLSADERQQTLNRLKSLDASIRP